MAVFSVKNKTGYYTLKLTLTEGNTNIENNTSPVNYNLQLVSGSNANFADIRIGSKVILNGSTVHNVARADAKQYTLPRNSTITLASGQTVIKHDNNGSKTIPVSFSIDMVSHSYTAGSLSGSGSMELSDIPRKATVTKASNFNDESNPTIEFTNPGGFEIIPYFNIYTDNTFTTRVYALTRPQGKYSSPYTFVLTDDERKKIRNATADKPEYVVNIGVTTYNGNTNLGYHSLPRTFSIINANPIFAKENITFADTNKISVAVTGDNQIIVQNKSLLSITAAPATGSKGATIEKYTFDLNGVKKTVLSTNIASVNMGSVAISGSVPLKVTAIDSRGFPTSVTKNIEVVPYNKPIIGLHSNYGMIVCKRCDANGVLDDSGTYLKLIVQGKWSSLPNNKNVAQFEIQCTAIDYQSSWVLIEGTTQGGGKEDGYISWSDVDTVVSSIMLNPRRPYIITIKITDAFGEYTDISIKIPSEDVTFHLKKGGGGAAFGGYSTEEKVLNMYDWKLKFADLYMNDMISEEGNSGIWKYIKLANGLAVCMGTAIVDKTAFTTSWGNLYYADKHLSAINYPFEFAERPQEFVNARTEDSAVWSYSDSRLSGSGMNTTTKTANYNACRPTSITTLQNIYYDIFVIGKIKDKSEEV